MMLNKNELRLGNYLVEKFSNTYVTVTGLTDTGVYVTGSFKDKWQAVPVELTDELLISLGWIWNEECHSFEKFPNGDARLFISRQRGLNLKRTVFNYVLTATIAEIKYLHELQNLFFLLKGKELEVSL